MDNIYCVILLWLRACRLLDSYQLPDVLGSDHCPVGITVVKND